MSQPSDQEILTVFKEISNDLKRIADRLEKGTIIVQRV
jgi:Ni,Fe-hydrogenase III large subunit